MSNHSLLAALACLLAALPTDAQGRLSRGIPAQGGQPQSNVLIVIADDLGIDQLLSYGVGSVLPFTPTISSLSASGLRFTRAWATPYCSPTRAAVMTGRYSYRHGVGSVIGQGESSLSLYEHTLPELVDAATGGAFENGAFGKWHLGQYADSFAVSGDLGSPNDHGWSHFVGTMQNVQNHYYYAKTENGSAREYFGYTSSDLVDEFLLWQDEIEEPWLALLSFNAAHVPLTAPPPHLHSIDLAGKTSETHPVDFYQAMIEALDTELGRALDGLGSSLAQTNVIFLGDNGSTPIGVSPPFMPDHAKGTLYEGGIHIPLIISGPAVASPGGQCDALVHAVDVFSTAAELCGVDLATSYPQGVALDSLSLLPYLSNPSLPSERTLLFTEYFEPNLPAPTVRHDRTVRNFTHKLIVHEQFSPIYKRSEELYYLPFDFFELNDLLLAGGPAALSGADAVAYRELSNGLGQFVRPPVNGPIVSTQ